ncbi:hypothetical protein G9464_08555 [Halostella sp. JP-L12]|uniref:integrin alpha n=1 Tax=Halostella TaxID=1843185 RepID=UPI000EF7DCEF|nr:MULTISPECIES: integrin alpha [Halostella]NHN47646.1 hypothetical protein [Halostella sp. JP-L12]
MGGSKERRRAVALAAITVLGILVAGFGPIGAAAGGDDGFDSGDASDGADVVQQQEGGTLSGEINLTDAEATIRGDRGDDRFGSAIAPAGDVNGDGNDDVIVGAQFADATANRSGAAYLFYGPVEDGEYDAADANLTLRGESGGDWAGYSVASGDVNGDGLSDLIVGAPLEDEAGSDAGAAYVFYGADDLEGSVNLSEADAKLLGEGAGDQFGLSVAAADVDGDGTDAVVAGAPRNSGAGEEAGAAYVFEIDGDVMLSASDADAAYHGESASDRAGWAVANAGDANDDGVDDVLVGAPQNNSTAPNAGAAYLVTDGGAASLAAATKMNGEGAGDLAGWSVSDAGDVNNDSVDDVLVGAPRNDTTGNAAGSAYVVHGSDSLPDEIDLADADVRLRGEDAGDRAGYSVSSAGSGDVTCDAIDDVLVGAPMADSTGNNSGTAYLVYGSDDAPENRSLATAEAKLHGEGAGDRAGVAVSDVEDLSGDGNEDVAVGAPRNDTVGENNGAAYLVNGKCPVEEEEPKTTKKETTTEHETKTEKETTETATEKDTTTERETTTEKETTTEVEIAPQTTDTTTEQETTTETQTTTETTTPTTTETTTPTTTDTTTETTTTETTTRTTTETTTPTTTTPTTTTPTTTTPTTTTPTTTTPTTTTPTTTTPTTTETTTETTTPPDSQQPAISFVALCIAEDTEVPEDFDTSVQATGYKTEDGTTDTSEPISAEWSATNVTISSVVVYGGGEFERFNGGDGGSFTFGEGTSISGVSQSNPCPSGETLLVKYEWNGNSFDAEIENENALFADLPSANLGGLLALVAGAALAVRRQL